MARFDVADIRDYYDRHTPSFIRFGQGGRAGAIHRAVWGPGVDTRLGALHYVDDRIAELAQSLSVAGTMPHLVDRGFTTSEARPSNGSRRASRQRIGRGSRVTGSG